MRRFFYLSFGFIFILQCSDQNSVMEVDKPAELLLPLQVGNYWIYRVGKKATGQSQVETEVDTLTVKFKNETGYYLESRTEVPFLNGFYQNRNEGLYFKEELNFKYPGEIGENAGSLNASDSSNFAGENPEGKIFNNQYSARIVLSSGDTLRLSNCYYYFLESFYITRNVKRTGYTIFKPGIGMIQKDWVDIDSSTNKFFNPFAVLINYKLN